jgi:hypothetical protein
LNIHSEIATMTSTVNLVAFRNLSIFGQQGTGALGHMSMTTPFLPPKSMDVKYHFSQLNESQMKLMHHNIDPFAVVKESTSTTASMNEDYEEVHQISIDGNDRSAGNSKKRGRTGVVRFAVPESERTEESGEEKSRKGLKRRKFEKSDADFWWSQEELKNIQDKCIASIKKLDYELPMPFEEDDHASLERYSSRNQKSRRLVRFRMKETLRAVKEFEASTKTNSPPEMLAQLLQRYSESTADEACKRGLKTAAICAVLKTRRTSTMMDSRISSRQALKAR